MSCSTRNYKNCHFKSCEQYYNTNPQALAAGATIPLNILGNRVVDTGVSIEAEPNGFQTLKTGLYAISADIVINTTTDGDVILQIKRDGVVLPCSVRRFTAGTGYREVHTETKQLIEGCCADVSHTFTFELVSVDTAVSSVTSVCAGMTKLA